ncbi:RNA polymerase sigma factor [Gordonia caeni]|uniref:RNA polymerase sigma factor n=1 Tax=Gordonia caeni TaxID=1007097 RepID=UPI0031E36AC3
MGSGSANDHAAALLQSAMAGDQHAYAELAGAHRNRLWSVCYRITGNPEDAEDALQETLLAAWRGLATFRGDSAFSSWLYRIASNAALAQAKRRPQTLTIENHEFAAEGDFTTDVAWSDLIQEALDNLPEHYRVPFVLRVYGDLTYQDIADQLAIPVQTVRSRLSRAKRALRENLGDPEDRS